MRTWILFIVVFALLLVFMGAMLGNNQDPFRPSDHIAQSKKVLLDELASMSADMAIPNETKRLKKLQSHLASFRMQYKEIEFLVDYFDPGSAAQINPNPFPKVDISNAQYLVLEPRGMQYIEELLYTEAADWTTIQLRIKWLNKSVEDLFVLSPINGQLNERSLYLAIRHGLLRIATLGITGFDAPENEDYLLESHRSLKSMQRYYSSLFPEADLTLWNITAKQLRQEPNQFSAFAFYKVAWNPLFASISTHAKNDSRILFSQTDLDYMVIRPFSSQFFSAEFFNEKAFAEEKDFTEEAEKLRLGKALFYDPILSANNQRACASCHSPAMAFTDGRAKSISFDQLGTVGRNSPSLLNAGFQSAQFWDLRENFLENQMDHVLQSHDEFNTSYTEVLGKLKQSTDYGSLFSAAFPQFKEAISYKSLNIALATYVRSLVAMESPFDAMINGEEKEQPSVAKGFDLFMGKAACGTCHFPPTFSGLLPPFYNESESEVLGVPFYASLDSQVLDPDLGRYHIHQAGLFRNGFKTPGLRHIQETAPYMHNGVFTTLDTVLEFYNQGGGAGLGIPVTNQTLPSEKLNLNPEEISQLLSFLASLSGKGVYFEAPTQLPRFSDSSLNARKIGGFY